MGRPCPNDQPGAELNTSISSLPKTPARFVWHFFWQLRGWYALIVLFEMAAATSSVMLPYAMGQVVGVVSDALNPQTASASLPSLVMTPMLLFVALSLGELVFNRASGACRVMAAPRQRTTVARELFAYLQHHSHRYITNHFAGALASRISETAVGVNMTIAAFLFDFLPLVVTLGVAIVLLYHASISLALFTLVWSAAFVAISYWFARRARPLAHQHAAARAVTTGQIVDAVTNLSTVRLFGESRYEHDRLKQIQENEIRQAHRSMWFNEKMQLFQQGAALVLKVGTLYFAFTLWRNGSIGVAEFVMSISLALMIIGEARNIGRRFIEIFEYTGNISNGVQTLLQPHEITDAPDARDVTIERGGIELCDVTFGYDPAHPVFTHLNLTIPAGQRVGLVGFSGSGKSTLVNLILRLYEPQAGSIRIDGVDIREMTQQSLHRQIAYIPQEPGLFHRSLLDNIRYGRLDATEAEVIEAAMKASADDFIQELPTGYESLVGERGVKLSGGQRQRIAIARVALKQAPILIMDEATSSLDSLTERAIQNSLDLLMSGKTVIVIAHRLSTIAHLDRILVFDQGRIVEDGSHAELLARRGTYWRLWTQQSDGFLPDVETTDGIAPSAGHART